jgi:hypothetical protein
VPVGLPGPVEVLVWWIALALADDVGPSAALTATGGVGAAATHENAAITLNPGMLGLARRYDFQAQGGFGVEAGGSWGASLVDARTSEHFAGGLSYTGSVAQPEIRTPELPGWITPGTEIPNRKRYHDFALGGASPFADDRASLGLAANLGYFSHDRQGTGWLFDLDAGLGLTPFRHVVLGLAGRNFLPLAGEDRPAEVVGGLRIEPERRFANPGDGTSGAVEADVTWHTASDLPLPLAFAAGAELQFNALRLRAGWRREAMPTPLVAAGTHSVSTGFGLHGGTGSFEMAAVLPVSGGVQAENLTIFASVRVVGGPDIPLPE